MREFLLDPDLDVKASSILVVDDEPANIRLIERTLSTEGYLNIASTIDSRETLSLCRENNFDLILLDLNMPHMDGYEVMAQLYEIFSDDLPPVLVLTAQSAQEFRLRALQGGARDYVTKPFDRLELLARVQNLIDMQLARKLLRGQKDALEEKVRKRTQELHFTRLQVVRRLGRAAEYRDNETGMHIIRMSKVSELLGLAVGLEEYQCDLLLNASPMHDIGKIGIPDEILLKPGKFEPHEWEIMKTHSQIGADILTGDDSDLLSMAKDIAITHHEKWNGSGYPNSLEGEEIPLVGRIVAVADVFDALTSVRPYKKAWTVDNAVDLIKEESGKHFQPELVNLFLENLPEIVKIKERYAEPEEE